LKVFKGENMKIKFASTSSKDKVQTIYTSQFEGRNFRYGEKYRLYFENGKSVVASVNRKNAKSLAISNDVLPNGLKLAKVGNPVFRLIKSLRKIS
jgi:hypothetical protein